MEPENRLEEYFPGDETIDTDEADKYLTFFVGEQVYGLSIRQVNGIIQMQEITSMPELPYYIKGIINMRGTVIPVLSVHLRFGQAEQEYHERTCIIILDRGDSQAGVIVDAVEAVLDIPPESIAPHPAMASQGESFVTGIAKVGGGKMVLLLDTDLLVGDGLPR